MRLATYTGRGLIDLHTHILPGLDDGSHSVEESVEMARLAFADGTRVMVATPHSSDWSLPGSQEELARKAAEVEAAIRAEGLAVRVLPGMEVYALPDLVQRLREGVICPINGGRYVLIEIPFQFYPPFTDQVFFELQIAGYVPILAHPERCEPLMRDPKLLRRLVERGTLGQVTAASLVGGFGPRVRATAEEFVRSRLVHVIASDTHWPTGNRQPGLSAGMEVAARLLGEEAARAMVEAVPQAVIDNQTVDVELPESPRDKKSWFFWR